LKEVAFDECQMTEDDLNTQIPTFGHPKTNMSFPRKRESPTKPDKTKTRCPLTPRRTSPRAWQTN